MSREEPDDGAEMFLARAEAIRRLKMAVATEAARTRLEQAASYYERLAERVRRNTGD